MKTKDQTIGYQPFICLTDDASRPQLADGQPQFLEVVVKLRAHGEGEEVGEVIGIHLEGRGHMPEAQGAMVVLVQVVEHRLRVLLGTAAGHRSGGGGANHWDGLVEFHAPSGLLALQVLQVPPGLPQLGAGQGVVDRRLQVMVDHHEQGRGAMEGPACDRGRTRRRGQMGSIRLRDAGLQDLLQWAVRVRVDREAEVGEATFTPKAPCAAGRLRVVPPAPWLAVATLGRDVVPAGAAVARGGTNQRLLVWAKEVEGRLPEQVDAETGEFVKQFEQRPGQARFEQGLTFLERKERPNFQPGVRVATRNTIAFRARGGRRAA